VTFEAPDEGVQLTTFSCLRHFMRRRHKHRLETTCDKTGLWNGGSSAPVAGSLAALRPNYDLKRGCYLTSAPITSTSSNAPSGNVWLVPIGGGMGRIMRLGFQPVNVSVQAYRNYIGSRH
jgi:hypothetical protein